MVEDDLEPGARPGLAPHFQSSLNLSDQVRDQLKPKGCGALLVKVGSEAPAVVADLQANLRTFALAEFDPDGGGLAEWETMLQGVREEFGDDQSAGDGLIEVDAHRAEVAVEFHLTRDGDQGLEQLIGEFSEIVGEVELSEVVGLVKRLVQNRHRLDPVPRVFEHGARAFVVAPVRLQAEKAEITCMLFFTR